MYEEKLISNPKFSSITSVCRSYQYKTVLGEIKLKSASVNYIGSILLNSKLKVIEINDNKRETDDWFRSEFRFIDSSKSMKNIPFAKLNAH